MLFRIILITLVVGATTRHINKDDFKKAYGLFLKDYVKAVQQEDADDDNDVALLKQESKEISKDAKFHNDDKMIDNEIEMLLKDNDVMPAAAIEEREAFEKKRSLEKKEAKKDHDPLYWGGYGTTPSPSCVDAGYLCFMYSCNSTYATDNCKKKCGNCYTDTATTPNTNDTATTQNPWTTPYYTDSGGFGTTPSTCVDYSNYCYLYSGQCHDPMNRDYLMVNCAKYCNFCGANRTATTPNAWTTPYYTDSGGWGTTPSTSCVDHSMYCYSEYCYQSWYKTNCARTCGTCGANKTATTPNAWTTPYYTDSGGWGTTPSTGCVDRSMYCYTEYCWMDWYKSNCARSCGMCEPEKTELEKIAEVVKKVADILSEAHREFKRFALAVNMADAYISEVAEVFTNFAEVLHQAPKRIKDAGKVFGEVAAIVKKALAHRSDVENVIKHFDFIKLHFLSNVEGELANLADNIGNGAAGIKSKLGGAVKNFVSDQLSSRSHTEKKFVDVMKRVAKHDIKSAEKPKPKSEKRSSVKKEIDFGAILSSIKNSDLNLGEIKKKVEMLDPKSMAKFAHIDPDVLKAMAKMAFGSKDARKKRSISK